MVRLSPLSFRVVGETARGDEPMLSAAPAQTDHVGLLLKEAREALGRDLDEIAIALRIRRGHLGAIEAGQFDELPGPTYAVGFIRTYADFLGLDGTAIIERFKSEARDYSEVQTELEFPAVTEGRFPSGAVVLTAVILAVGGFVAWSYLPDERPPVAERVAEPPALVATTVVAGIQVPSPPQAAVAPPPPAGIEVPKLALAIEELPATPATIDAAAVSDAVPAVADLTGSSLSAAGADSAAPPEPGGVVSDASPLSPAADEGIVDTADRAVAEPEPVEDVVEAALPPPSPRAAIAAEAPKSAPAQLAGLPAVPAVTESRVGGRVYGQVNVDARIVLTATSDSWVQVRDDQQNVLLTRMLQPGDSYRVPNRDGLTLFTGNAGGLVIKVDGRAIESLGPPGAVRRDIRLDPASLGLADD